MYSPTLDRFMQTDPIGYANGVNWYNYVGSDPVNAIDPFGLQTCPHKGNRAAIGCEVVVQPAVTPDGNGGNFSDGSGRSVILNGTLGHGGVGGVGALGGGGTGALQKDTSASHCAAVAVKKNARAIALDVASVGLSLAPGGRAGVALGGLALGAVGLTNSAFSADTRRPGISLSSISLGIAGFHVASAGPLASAFEASSAVAKYLPGIGTGLAVIQSGVDAYNGYLDYQECREGK
ncbi:MAG: hypothetical protein P0Y59_05360 [Candidatus Sphingomonas phytovorans]|nr:RHS repeat-associated core domain-containing protein [Sphingomonas sp.]WEK01118.1 MAG: hypothetical protein P0Y59_05360 [Sphingomonas sp.]